MFREGDWTCADCDAHNFSKRTDCYKCHVAKGSGGGRKRKGGGEAARDDDSSSGDEAEDDRPGAGGGATSYDMLMHSLVKSTGSHVLEAFTEDGPAAEGGQTGVPVLGMELTDVGDGHGGQGGAGEEADEGDSGAGGACVDEDADIMLRKYFHADSASVKFMADFIGGASQKKQKQKKKTKKKQSKKDKTAAAAAVAAMQLAKKFSCKGPVHVVGSTSDPKGKAHRGGNAAARPHTLHLAVHCTGAAAQVVNPQSLCGGVRPSSQKARGQPKSQVGYLDQVPRFQLSTLAFELADASAATAAGKNKKLGHASLMSSPASGTPAGGAPKRAKRTRIDGAAGGGGGGGAAAAAASYASVGGAEEALPAAAVGAAVRCPIVLSDRLAPFRGWPAPLRTRLGMELLQLLGSYSDCSMHGLAKAAMATRAYSGLEHHRLCKTLDSATHCAVVLHLLNHALKAYAIVQRHTNRLAKVAERTRAKKKARHMRMRLASAQARRTAGSGARSASHNNRGGGAASRQGTNEGAKQGEGGGNGDEDEAHDDEEEEEEEEGGAGGQEEEDEDEEEGEEEEEEGDDEEEEPQKGADGNDSDADDGSDDSGDGGEASHRSGGPSAQRDDDDDEDEEHGEEEHDYRDQGFTRPKVLIVAPMRSDALRLVQTMQQLLPPGQVPNGIERFLAEFDAPASDDDGDEDQDEEEEEEEQEEDQDHDGLGTGGAPNRKKTATTKKKTTKTKHKARPEWKEIFDGNADDDFLLGIAIRRRQLKLYAGVYNCDIVLASPLGLRRKVGAPVDKHRDYDFLSSIEVAYVDRTDVVLMQNWLHMGEIFDVTNLMPQASHGADFSRIRTVTLDGYAKQQRQTIVSGAFDDAAVNQFMRQQCDNTSGLVKLGASLDTSAKDGVLSRVALSMRQLFHRVPVPSGQPADVGDARFSFFRKQLLPLFLGRGAQRRTLIFVASYFDFVRVRNLLHETVPDDFAMCSEYSRQQDVSRNRSNFFHGRVATLLTTERFYFYKRYRFRGAQHVIFYGVPKHSDFFCDTLNALDTDGQQVQCTSSVLFTQFDLLELQRVVGTKRATKMIRGVKDTFMFF